MLSTKQQFLSGLRAGIPVLFGFVPVGIAYALSARQAGLSAAETIAMSALVFAGASQMMAVGMVAQGGAALPIVLATFLLNLRHFIMSACVSRLLPPAPAAKKLAAAFFVTDESFAIFTTQGEEHRSYAFFFGLIALTYSSWVGGSAIGALLSDFLPEILTNSFGIALYAMFISLLLPGLPGRPRLILLVTLTAALHCALRCFLPPSWALILATVLGAAAGVFFTEDAPAREEARP